MNKTDLFFNWKTFAGIIIALTVMLLLASCTATQSSQIYGNQNSHCESYQ